MKVNKYKEYLKFKDKYEIIRQEIMNLIEEYYIFNDNFRIEHLGDTKHSYMSITNLNKSDEKDYETGEYWYWVEYHYPYADKNFDKISQSEFDDIMKFIDNPEVYKKAKKFNL